MFALGMVYGRTKPAGQQVNSYTNSQQLWPLEHNSNHHSAIITAPHKRHPIKPLIKPTARQEIWTISWSDADK